MIFVLNSERDKVGINPLCNRDFSQLIASKESRVDLAEPGVAEALVEECYFRYCSEEARAESSHGHDGNLHNMKLRIRDFASLVEADRAMRDGDVGRMLLMWKRWSILAQGMEGMGNYALALPRYILLLEEFLPPSVGRAIRHSLLISPSGLAGHFVGKDFYLEMQNYWLKYFYNHSVSSFFLNKR